MARDWWKTFWTRAVWPRGLPLSDALKRELAPRNGNRLSPGWARVRDGRRYCYQHDDRGIEVRYEWTAERRGWTVSVDGVPGSAYPTAREARDAADRMTPADGKPQPTALATEPAKEREDKGV